jgi:hypothetical protein
MVIMSIRMRMAQITKITILVSYILALVSYLPYGTGGAVYFSAGGQIIEDNSTFQILWLTIPSSVSINEMLTYLFPILQQVAIAIVLLGLIVLIHVRVGSWKIFGRFGLVLLILGVSSIFLSGIFEAFRNASFNDPLVTYATLTQFFGMTIYVFGVLLLVRNLTLSKRSDKLIGMSFIGIGGIFLLLLTSALFAQQFSQSYNSDLWNYLNTSGIISFPLIMIGILWIENGIARSLVRKIVLVKTAMLVSITVLFIGTGYLIAPFVGYWDTGPLAWGTFVSSFLTYLYFLGILMVLALTIALGFRGVKITRRVNDMACPSEDEKGMLLDRL